jgi:tetratricopeptide (TPR) repeat protein
MPALSLLCCLLTVALPTLATPPATAPATAAAVSPVVSPAMSNKDAEQQFKLGVAAFQKGDDKTAHAAFGAALKFDPENAVTLHNLAMTSAREGQLGLAMALWRKALLLRPGYPAAEKGLTWTKTKLEHPEIAHDVEYWESFRSVVLVEASLSTFLCFTAVSLFFAGWLLLTYLGARRRALLEETSLPNFPTVAVIFTALFCLFALIDAAKLWDLETPRGTVLAKKVEARSAPDAASTALFDLYEGLEVTIDQVNSGWAQVSYPGGPTGWIPATSILTAHDQVPM